jgi:hypothetical protein
VAEGLCTGSGDSRASEGYTWMWKGDDPSSGSDYDPVDCIGTGVHHASTAGFIVGGVAAAFAAVYYIFFQRPSVEIVNKARASAEARRRARTAALPAKLPEVN